MHDKPRHYCGIFGILGSNQASKDIYFGLRSLQHRGQESAGIATSTGAGEFHTHLGMGLVTEVFTEDILTTLTGSMGIGHTRYSTCGGSERRNIQPFVANTKFGPVAIGHNGTLGDTRELRKELERKNAVFQTDTDSEVFLMCIVYSEQDTLEDAIHCAVQRISGAYSFLIMTHDKLMGVRDPYGFRPLSFGKVNGETYMLASETSAFSRIGGTHLRDVLPGEMLILKHGEEPKTKQLFLNHTRRAFCIFEYIYFARPDSMFNGRSIYSTRVALGHTLAKEHPVQGDIVVPIPDSGVPAAVGVSRELGIPLEFAFVRDHYNGKRSFILPTEYARIEAVDAKLTLIAELVRGKRTIIVDDSMVRGTTGRQRTTLLRTAGATEVHILISCPPHMHPCYYGIDFPDRTKLIAVGRTCEEICKEIGADSVRYLSEEGMVATVGHHTDVCLACFNGKYPDAVTVA